MSRPDEGLIHQWLDGECTPEDAARIEQLVATDPAWAAAVAEARGLIAASSRIVGALDAVPRARPVPAAPATAPTAASRGDAPRRFRVPRWIGVAAGVVLVAGTAYVVSQDGTPAFAPVAVPSSEPTRVAFDTAPGVQIVTDPRALQPPRDVPATMVAPPQMLPSAPSPTPAAAPPSAPAAVVTSAPRDNASVAAPTTVPAFVGEVAAAQKRAEADAADRAQEQERARASAVARRAPLVAESPRGAGTRDAAGVAAAAAAAPAPALPTLAGCWRVSAPPELVGVLDAPEIRRARGDTLVLVTPRGDVTVTRSGDELRGGLQAKLEPCGSRD